MEEITFIPKYEFRIFGQSFGSLETLIQENAEYKSEQYNEEIYLLTAADNENNVKIRNGKMDMKILEENMVGLEFWTQYMIGDFPMDKEIIANTVFPALGVPSPTFDRNDYSLNQFLNELVYFDPDVIVAYTFKHHKNYVFNNCELEITEVLVNNSFIKTICVESQNYEDVLKVKTLLKIDDKTDNVSYPKALKRIMGLEKLPDEWINKMKEFFKK